MSLAALVAPPQRLAVDGHHTLRPLDLGRLGEGLHEPLERLLEGLRIEHAEHPAEGVVAGQPVLQPQDRLQQIGFRPGKQRHVRAVRRSAQRRQQGDKQQVCKIVQRVGTPRVRHVRKTRHEALPLAPHRMEPTSESIYRARTTTYSSEHAIPLRAGGGLGEGVMQEAIFVLHPSPMSPVCTPR